MSDEFLAALAFFVLTFGELAGLFVAISFVVSFIQQKLPAEKVQKLLSGNRGYGIAVALGAITPFCSCSTLPMTIGLIKARAAFGPIMAFLFTSPLLNPFIVGLFLISFGAKITLIYALFVVVLAISSGALLEKLNFIRFIRQELLADSSTVGCSGSSTAQVNMPTLCCDATTTQSLTASCSEPKNAGVSSCASASKCTPASKTSSCSESNTEKLANNGSNWRLLMNETITQFTTFVPYMIIGVAIGAALHGYVPEQFFAQLATGSVYWMIPTTAIIGVFLYVRASTMVPIALSLVAKGMSMGAVISLTIGGAGASLPEMIMMKRMFHWPLLLAFVALVFTTACVTGFAIELL